MPDPRLAAQMAADLMLTAARSVTRHQVRNAFAGWDECPDLDTPDAEQLITTVLEIVETADIEIDTGA